MKRLKPDLVLLAIYAGNDFGDPIRNKLFRLDESQQQLTRNWSVNPEPLFRALRKARITPFVLRTSNWWIRNPLRQRMLRREMTTPTEITRRALAASLAEFRSFVIERNNDVGINVLADHYDAGVAMSPDSEPARCKVMLMEGLLLEIQRLTFSEKLPLAILIIPHAIDVCNVKLLGDVDTAEFPKIQALNASRSRRIMRPHTSTYSSPLGVTGPSSSTSAGPILTGMLRAKNSPRNSRRS